jgi:N6-L-threonylcarbamoyladenine synthase
LIVLGIETSCDETAAAVVDDRGTIRSNVVLSQIEEHRPYGGIVPEIAARAHLETIEDVIRRAMDDAEMEFSALDGIAATAGPGLIGGLIVGVMTAKGIAAAHDLPFLAVNHLEGHALTARLTDRAAFPYLLLLVSGGHCQILAVEAVGRYTRLGTTLDDAVGEAFDKVAKMLGLGYPGGPEVERMAARGNREKFDFPRPMKGRPGCDFSFSGLKTSVRHAIEALPAGELDERDIADICASFQEAVGEALEDRCARAVRIFRERWPAGESLVVAGGVAANRNLRERLERMCGRRGMKFVAPPLGLCTDNAAMIAWAGLERLAKGDTDGLDFAPRPRWPLDPDAAPATGAGVKA